MPRINDTLKTLFGRNSHSVNKEDKLSITLQLPVKLKASTLSWFVGSDIMILVLFKWFQAKFGTYWHFFCVLYINNLNCLNHKFLKSIFGYIYIFLKYFIFLIIDNSCFFSNKDRAMKFLHTVHIYNANILYVFHEDWFIIFFVIIIFILVW